MAFNVGLLADGLDLKLTSLASDLDQLTSEVDWLSMKANNARERQARRNIRKLTTKKHVEV